ncbi:MAG: FtsW/RodA/SpoVE family cell cycle protein, partial [Candidatus Cloacimonetes bacterium]|nr:FtsW/RodA/SpoVE family cell cycle protein [Candidatus Cloacimonadota bacterium]
MNNIKYDYYLIFLWLLLMIFGVISIYTSSATKFGDEVSVAGFYMRQLIWVGISLTVVLVLLKIPWRLQEIFIDPAYIGVLLLLGIVLFLPEIKGSHRWMRLAGFQIQPSELAKLTTILFVAKRIAKSHTTTFQSFYRSLTGFFVPIILILVEPDLGTAMTIGFIWLMMLSVTNVSSMTLFIMVSPVLSL